jgi:hypothetical protein
MLRNMTSAIAHCPNCYKRLYAECEECGDEVHNHDADAAEQASGGWLCWFHAPDPVQLKSKGVHRLRIGHIGP